MPTAATRRPKRYTYGGNFCVAESGCIGRQLQLAEYLFYITLLVPARSGNIGKLYRMTTAISDWLSAMKFLNNDTIAVL
jgi:hypothetical protein